ncbi:YdiU family protein [Reyranella sp. CPCC 100927]|uniref:protein adenylyltransferase SelO n=1 Tax=Reyranella sp. CPCC 100927 TaxID=2599616 RepID=UPI0011B3D2DE|nr:YdiU family protein [Reyranella sp. CPCC 100927]TWT05946.1 YdiU family protein [Reyranella sp. CPCC 100927]
MVDAPALAPTNPAGSSPVALFPFDNSYARLPDRFFARLAPTPVPQPQLVKLNRVLAQALSLDPEALAAPSGVEILAGNRLPLGADPLAMAYAGHQFGNWVPQLGDGRALLLGEVIDRQGVRYDIQLKGAGRTPFSRSGDGRAVLGPVLREYIISEAMAALGVATTRSLAAVTTGEQIFRQGLLPGAVLTRVARSHVRIGTFQFFASRGDVDGVRLLADYVIDRLYPQAAQPYRALLDAVIERTAALVASWQLIGFIHGVMNTDNMSIAGETIDYGPCAFMDTYHPGTVYSSIDAGGRYAYGNQPRIAHWNLVRLAQALLPLLGDSEDAAVATAQAAIDTYPARFESAWLAGLRRKLGLAQAHDGDMALAQELLTVMAAQSTDFTLTFRRLGDCVDDDPTAMAAVRSLFADPAAFDAWAVQWRQRLAREGRAAAAIQADMRAANPAFIPRNHRVEAVIAAAQTNQDFKPLEELLTVLAQPYDDQPRLAHYAQPPEPHEVVQQTFCGT